MKEVAIGVVGAQGSGLECLSNSVMWSCSSWTGLSLRPARAFADCCDTGRAWLGASGVGGIYLCFAFDSWERSGGSVEGYRGVAGRLDLGSCSVLMF